MKKTLLVLIISLFFFTDSYAQDNRSGIRGSFNLTNLYVDDVDDENLKPGFSVGVYFNNRLSDLISIQPEINYALKGSQITYNNIFASGEYRYNFSYIEVPILANIHVSEALYLSAGPYIATLIGVKIKDVNSDGTTNTVTQLDRDDFNTLDYGLAAGIGFSFEGGSLGLRYNYGLVNVENDNNDAITNGKNSAFQLFIGFDF